jgi:hypothetical protein
VATLEGTEALDPLEFDNTERMMSLVPAPTASNVTVTVTWNADGSASMPPAWV